jgi:multidrug transporter EmrE-like cation transporter
MVKWQQMEQLVIAIYLVLTVAGLTLVKLGSKGAALVSKNGDKLVWNMGPVVFLGLFAYGLSFLLLMWMVSKYELSVLIPLTTALGQILVFIVAVTVFKEQFTLLKFMALILIITGVVLLQIKTGATPG